MRLDDEAVRRQVGRIEELLAELETQQDSAGGAAGMTAVQALVDVYGEALARIVERIGNKDAELVVGLADDELVSHLLLVHELHPVDVSTRANNALEAVRSSLGSSKVSLELLEIDGASVRISMSGGGCSAEAVKSEVEQAMRMAVPEIEQVEVQTAAAAAEPAFVPLESLLAR